MSLLPLLRMENACIFKKIQSNTNPVSHLRKVEHTSKLGGNPKIKGKKKSFLHKSS